MPCAGIYGDTVTLSGWVVNDVTCTLEFRYRSAGYMEHMVGKVGITHPVLTVEQSSHRWTRTTVLSVSF